MFLGRSATPYGGGRLIGLFSHKKYDVLTVEYLDQNGGLHGAIFELHRGQGQDFKNALLAAGAHIGPKENQAAQKSPSEIHNDNK